jgi:hypothetical protein
MPGSIPNPIFYFPAKVAIYSLAGWALNKVYKAGPNPLLFGILRVAFGFGIGFLMLFAIEPLTSPPKTTLADYIWLASTRFLVWTGMIWFFYERKNFSPLRFIIVVLSGILLSFGIDAAFAWIDDEFSGMFSIGMC